MIKLVAIRDGEDPGIRDVVFEVNGNNTVIHIKDESADLGAQGASIRYADDSEPGEVGANISGSIMKILVKEGDKVKEKQPVAIIEAMKMETNVLATIDGKVTQVAVKEGTQVDSGELIAVIQAEKA